jgi:anti-sigma factor RsiW
VKLWCCTILMGTFFVWSILEAVTMANPKGAKTLEGNTPAGVTAELSCREIVEFLADYLDGTLAAASRARFEEHLAECPQCLAYLDGYRATIQLEKDAFASGSESRDVPQELIEAILAARRQQD